MKLMDISALSQMLGLPKSWIYERTRPSSCAAVIPHIKAGKYLRFNPESADFKEWLASLNVNQHNRPREKGRVMEAETMTRSTYQKGSVQKRKRKNRTIYVLRYRLRDGSQWIEKTEELKASTDREARRAADVRMVEINNRNNGEYPMMTVERFAQTLYRDFLKDKKISTQYIYEHSIQKHVTPFLGAKNLDEVTPVDIKDLLKKASEKVTDSSLLCVYTQIRGFFSLAVEYGLIEVSPVRPKIHRPKVARREKPVLSADKVQKVFAQFAQEHRLLFVLLGVYLLRIGEVLGLRWMNFNYEAKTLSIENTLWQKHLITPKTEGSKKTFQLPEVIAEALQLHKDQSRWNGPNDFIFCEPTGKYLSEWVIRKRVWYPALEAVGIERRKSSHGFHLLRHSGATLLYALTKDLKLVQNHARHSNISTTGDLYIHSEGLMSEEPSEILTGAFFGGLTVAEIHGKPN
jgi:integrase